MASATQIYTLALAANQAQVLLVEGGFYKILSATGPVSVSREGGSIINPMRVGQGERLRFTRLTIQDVSGAANTVEVIIADESFVDDRISGEVSVIDGGKSRTLARVAYIGAVNCPAVAAQYAHAQLFNWSGNPNRVILESFWICSTNTVNVSMYSASSNLSTPGSPFNPGSKNMDGASSLARAYYQNAAAHVLSGTLRGYFQVLANTTFHVKLAEPMILAPTRGVSWIVGNALNTDLLVTAEFYEEPNT